jgi:S1-C subfamily serine protease
MPSLTHHYSTKPTAAPQTTHGNLISWKVTLLVIALSFASLMGRPIQAQQVTTASAITPIATSDSAGIDLKQLDYLPEERLNIAVYERCNRSVVHIATKSVSLDSFSQLKLREGSGSGSVIDKSGIILTNYHVIEGARKISVGLHNGLFYEANLVGQDPDTDIAVLKIEAPAEYLQPVEFGGSEELRVGQRIYAIGNPFGLERTMSTGMISSLDRQIPSKTGRSMRSLIQLDATLNQGNSGGPLLNTRGQQIGMNTAIISSDGDSAGVGFAIPSSTLRRIVPQLIQHGKVIRASIGISRVYESDKGLLIVNTEPGGPAERAGLQGFRLSTQIGRKGIFQVEQTYYDLTTADLIIAINGQNVQSADHLLSLIESQRPGDIVQLTVQRDGRKHNVPVQLGEN